jgi:hypothetical protein|tara:strand:+ start:1525 stop:1926 length:402 start_codon:yes stop_codon:yes gene_type:complete
MIQTDKDFQSLLKIFEINQKIILTEIKKLPYQIRTDSRSRSRSGSYKLTPRVKDLFVLIRAEIDTAITVMAELKDQELLKLISHTTVSQRLRVILKIMDATFTALDKFDDQEIIMEHFHSHIQKISEFIQEDD